jgi:hypothetical protein
MSRPLGLVSGGDRGVWQAWLAALCAATASVWAVSLLVLLCVGGSAKKQPTPEEGGDLEAPRQRQELEMTAGGVRNADAADAPTTTTTSGGDGGGRNSAGRADDDACLQVICTVCVQCLFCILSTCPCG